MEYNILTYNPRFRIMMTYFLNTESFISQELIDLYFNKILGKLILTLLENFSVMARHATKTG